MTREEVRTELSRLYQAHGSLTAELVVRAAAEKDSPLHEHFEWDDAKAGHLYRLVQARTLIRDVRTISVGGQNQTVVHVPVEGVRGPGEYVPMNVLVRDVDAFQRALDAALHDVESAMRRLDELSSQQLPRKLRSRVSAATHSLTAARKELSPQ